MVDMLCRIPDIRDANNKHGNETMTKAEMRNEIAKLEDIRVTCSGNEACFAAVGDAIDAIKREVYKGQYAALEALGL